jgi:hypothetical protein
LTFLLEKSYTPANKMGMMDLHEEILLNPGSGENVWNRLEQAEITLYIRK